MKIMLSDQRRLTGHSLNSTHLDWSRFQNSKLKTQDYILILIWFNQVGLNLNNVVYESMIFIPYEVISDFVQNEKDSIAD